MSFDFESAIDTVQVSGTEDTRKIHSEKVIEKWMRTAHMGEMEESHGYGKVKGPCGDTIQIFLKIHDEKITDATFVTDGCAATIAAGSMACELVIGKNIKDVLTINQELILENLGGLPQGSIHCALLASNTIKEALADYLTSMNESLTRF